MYKYKYTWAYSLQRKHYPGGVSPVLHLARQRIAPTLPLKRGFLPWLYLHLQLYICVAVHFIHRLSVSVFQMNYLYYPLIVLRLPAPQKRSIASNLPTICVAVFHWITCMIQVYLVSLPTLKIGLMPQYRLWYWLMWAVWSRFCILRLNVDPLGTELQDTTGNVLRMEGLVNGDGVGGGLALHSVYIGQ